MVLTVAVVAVLISLSTMIRLALVRAVTPMIALTFLVTWHLFAAVPAVLHKVDPLVARVVLASVLTPVFRMAWRHMHIDRRAVKRYPLDDNRLLVDNHWLRITADIEATIEPGLADG